MTLGLWHFLFSIIFLVRSIALTLVTYTLEEILANHCTGALRVRMVDENYRQVSMEAFSGIRKDITLKELQLRTTTIGRINFIRVDYSDAGIEAYVSFQRMVGADNFCVESGNVNNG